MMGIRRRFGARAARTRLGVHNDPSLDQITGNKRCKCQEGRRCKAAWIGDVLGLPYGGAIGLSQSVNELLLQIGCRVFKFVKVLEDLVIINAKITRKIDRSDVPRQLWDQGHCLTMRQSKKGDVDV